MEWELLEREPLYRGFFGLERLRVRHERFNGGCQEVTRECLRHGPGVAVLPYDPERDEVVLIEQFRIGAIDDPRSPWLIEVIAGYCGPDETPEAVARREAREEAGCEVTDLVAMHRYYPTPAGSDEVIHLFLGRTSTAGLGGVHGLAEEQEDIRVHVVPSETAFRWMDEGRIDSAMPLIALYWFRRHHDAIRQRSETGS